MKRKAPYETYLLAALLIFLSLGAIYGGISLITDSTGDNLHLKLNEYIDYPFDDFFLPGVLLLAIFGIFPLTLIFPLLSKPKWPWADTFNIYHRRHWAWTYSLYTGVALIIWIDVQISFIGYIEFIQIAYSLYGLAIIIVCLLPKQMRFYAKKQSSHTKKPYDEDDFDSISS